MPEPTETTGTTETGIQRSLIAWGQLVRLPNVFTVLADVGAAFLVVGSGPNPTSRFVAVLIAGVLLYWGGMILNDLLDLQQDRQQRRSRPLAAGLISLGQARIAAITCFVGGIVAALISGQLPSGDLSTTWLPGVVAISLVVCIYAYDGPAKRTPLAPAAMGGCRVLSFLLGASPHFTAPVDVPNWVLAFAVGMGVYVMGVTLVGRREAVGDRAIHLVTGLIVVSLGGVLIAVAPQVAQEEMIWQFSPNGPFMMLIAMIAFPVVVRVFAAVQSPEPFLIQSAVRSGVLTIIPLSAAIAFLGAGPFWGLIVFAGVAPMLALSRHFRVT